ncbi:MAG TPA: hypothetical protein VFE47_25100 [Tepidisphaeraceae bacterium]|jgi:hypothetical protein|nr:hypothetical protein [Tepidisphaeraceae bacterium]
MSCVESIRTELQRLIRAAPFRKFALVLESGNRVVIEHPENIAFDPEAKEPGADDFYVITGRIRMFSTFATVSSIALADQGGAAA